MNSSNNEDGRMSSISMGRYSNATVPMDVTIPDYLAREVLKLTVNSAEELEAVWSQVCCEGVGCFCAANSQTSAPSSCRPSRYGLCHVQVTSSRKFESGFMRPTLQRAIQQDGTSFTHLRVGCDT